MTDTTPDYAGLLERLEESPNHALILSAYERRELIAALRTLLESNAALERERDQLRDKLHCMCGSPIDHSAWEGHTPVSVYDYSLDQERSRAERAEAQLAEARKALEWHPIETAPLNTIVDLWCTYADAPASWGNDRPAGQIVHNRHKSKEHGWFGNESNDGIPQANGPDLVPVAWRWPAPEIPLEMMERFVAARRALEEQGGE